MSLITIDYRDRKLIYEQLIDNVKSLILRGDLKKDDFLPSVRSLARELAINPNTIQKAYAELERQGIIASLPGRGSIILTSSIAVADAGKDALRDELRILIERAHALGMTQDTFKILTAECWEIIETTSERSSSDND